MTMIAARRSGEWTMIAEATPTGDDFEALVYVSNGPDVCIRAVAWIRR